MNIIIRSALESDYDFILDLNEVNVEVLSPMDREKLAMFDSDAEQLLVAEIDTIPYNATSLEFHKAMGFREVGEQVVRGGSIRVSLQEAPVPI